jgi:hypothetical protein
MRRATAGSAAIERTSAWLSGSDQHQLARRVAAACGEPPPDVDEQLLVLARRDRADREDVGSGLDRHIGAHGRGGGQIVGERNDLAWRAGEPANVGVSLDLAPGCAGNAQAHPRQAEQAVERCQHVALGH